MNRLRCYWDTFWGTITMPPFWGSLIHPPLVVFDGHLWPYPPEWSEPRLSAHPDAWPGLVEVDLSRCERCGYQPAVMWRRYFS